MTLVFAGQQLFVTREFDQVIEDLYEGTLDLAAWNRALSSIADATHASGAIIFAFNPSNQEVLRNENHRIDPQVVSDYARYWTFEDFRLRYLFEQPAGRPATEVSLGIPLKGSRLYHEFLLPVDLPHFLPVWLHKTRQKMVCLSLQGSNRRGPFDAADLETIRRLLPHFARAFEIRDRLEAAEIRATNVANILDTKAFGVITLDSCRRVIEANHAASALLNEDSGLGLDREGVLRTSKLTADRFDQWMREAGARSATDALFHIPRVGKHPLSVLAVPVLRSRTLWLSNDPATTLLIFDAERPPTLSDKIIMKDLGLTEREAGVASLLASGLGVQQIAERLNVSVNTVRTQLHSTYQKTGCHTQADLTRRVLLGPGHISTSATCDKSFQ